MDLAITAWSVGAGIVLCLALHLTLRGSSHWLVATLLASGFYVVLSMQLERQAAPDWTEGLRWGLFGSALFSFLRYRFARRAERG